MPIRACSGGKCNVKIVSKREHRIVLCFLSLPNRELDKKRIKDGGTDDCMKHPLTQSESMLIALRSLRSIGSAPVVLHQRNLHPSKLDACQTVLKHKLTPCELQHKVRACAKATCTPELRP